MIKEFLLLVCIVLLALSAWSGISVWLYAHRLVSLLPGDPRLDRANVRSLHILVNALRLVLRKPLQPLMRRVEWRVGRGETRFLALVRYPEETTATSKSQSAIQGCDLVECSEPSTRSVMLETARGLNAVLSAVVNFILAKKGRTQSDV